MHKTNGKKEPTSLKKLSGFEVTIITENRKKNFFCERFFDYYC